MAGKPPAAVSLPRLKRNGVFGGIVIRLTPHSLRPAAVPHTGCRCGAEFFARQGGGLPGWSPGDRAIPEFAGGVPCLSSAAPAFSLLFCPHPPAPLPGGKGGAQSLFCRGRSPRHPCTEPPTALTDPAYRCTGGGLFTTRVPAAPAGANAPFEAERTGFPQAMPVPRPVQPQGCKGRSPLHAITLVSPFPGGEERSASAGGGMGATK